MDYITKLTESSLYQQLNNNKVYVGLAVLALFIGKRALSPYLALRKDYLSKSQLNAIKQQFFQKRQKQIDLAKKLITNVSQEKQEQIISVSAAQLANDIKDGKFTCEEVFLTFAYRASTIGVEHNLICDIDVENNLSLAQQKDEILKQTQDKSTLPVFFGVPITVKEHLKTKGLLSSCGYVQFAARPVENVDCAFVQLLREQGVIPFANTNVPQGLFAIESNNNLYGPSLNPFNKNLTVGGSSGGEGGAQATRISAFGIGSDSLGSARIPAAFCGVYSFKGTGKRISLKGRLGLTGTELGGFKDIQTSIGPMSKSIEDIINVEKIVLGNFNKIDDDSPPLYWNEKLFEETSLKKVKIGVIRRLNGVPNVAAIDNVLNETVEKLKSLGCQIHEMEGLPIDEMSIQIQKLLATPGVQLIIFKMLRGDEPLNIHKIFLKIKFTPQFINNLKIKFLELRGLIREAQFIKLTKTNDFITHATEQIKLEAYKKQMQQYIRDNKIDIIISPVTPFTATTHNSGGDLLQFLGLAGIPNILDLPSGVIPIRNVTVEEADPVKYKDQYSDKYTQIIRQCIQQSADTPIGLQISANTWKDEACLKIMKEISQLIDYNCKLKSE
ncbi:hypothetical protein ABPG74_022665 [Tetrahymena malaccensis]